MTAEVEMPPEMTREGTEIIEFGFTVAIVLGFSSAIIHVMASLHAVQFVAYLLSSLFPFISVHFRRPSASRRSLQRANNDSG